VTNKAPKHLVIATRGSQLALWQAKYVGSQLEALGFSFELNIIKTTGDRVQDRFLHEIGGKGLFVKELEEALRAGTADLAVHSLKDMPARTAAEFELPAILSRHSPNDALIVAGRHRTIVEQGPNEIQQWLKAAPRRIATSSLRRHAILQRLNPAIEIIPIRGNVDTRLRKLQENADWDGLILAEASMDRLALKPHWPTASLDPRWFLPSPSQGALAIEMRRGHPARAEIAKLGSNETALMVGVERGILAALGGDCNLPFAAFARKVGPDLLVDAQVFGRSLTCTARLAVPFTAESHQIDGWVLLILRQMRDNGLEAVLRELGLPLPTI
jgi:hydroxymethylbilane synthase